MSIDQKVPKPEESSIQHQEMNGFLFNFKTKTENQEYQFEDSIYNILEIAKEKKLKTQNSSEVLQTREIVQGVVVEINKGEPRAQDHTDQKTQKTQKFTDLKKYPGKI